MKDAIITLLTGIAVLFAVAGCAVAAGVSLWTSALFYLCAAAASFFLAAFLGRLK